MNCEKTTIVSHAYTSILEQGTLTPAVVCRDICMQELSGPCYLGFILYCKGVFLLPCHLLSPPLLYLFPLVVGSDPRSYNRLFSPLLSTVRALQFIAKTLQSFLPSSSRVELPTHASRCHQSTPSSSSCFIFLQKKSNLTTVGIRTPGSTTLLRGTIVNRTDGIHKNLYI